MVSKSYRTTRALRALSLTVTAFFLGAALAAPATSATPINACAPGNAVCVVQSDSPYAGPACNSYPWSYGVNSDKDEVRVNVGGVTAAAGAENMCANWFYNDGNYQGFYATAAAAGKSVVLHWYAFEIDYHWPGAPADNHGEYFRLFVNDGSGNTGVFWVHRVTPSTATDDCDTILYVQGSPTSLGCPAGEPPAPPTLPWGNLV